jgi:hypothetical protein
MNLGSVIFMFVIRNPKALSVNKALLFQNCNNFYKKLFKQLSGYFFQCKSTTESNDPICTSNIFFVLLRNDPKHVEYI